MLLVYSLMMTFSLFFFVLAVLQIIHACRYAYSINPNPWPWLTSQQAAEEMAVRVSISKLT
jgi:hypothetical protein